ncbi:hypothetical protein EI94DRAFT_1920943 [Lactarius quietus]|nr:hypothetical protein EI94DRAFT_1920943 [Lactarius quietus]
MAMTSMAATLSSSSESQAQAQIMATTSSSSQPQPQPQITVYASLPQRVADDGNIDLCSSNWEWVPCLTLPLMELNALNFSKRPYKWIQYAIGVVIGAHGDLSTNSDLSESNVQVVDYSAALPTNSIDLYYHTSNEEKKIMLPLGPDIVHTQLTSSVTSQKRERFHEEVAAWDGHRCVWTGLVNYSTDQGNEDDVITNINDIRNGLYLSLNSHAILGTDAAFLMTPKFAMDTDDVNDTAEPNERMCTTHVIKPHDEKFPPNLITGYSATLKLSHNGHGGIIGTGFPIYRGVEPLRIYKLFTLCTLELHNSTTLYQSLYLHKVRLYKPSLLHWLLHNNGPMTTANIGDEANIDDQSYAAITARRWPEELVIGRGLPNLHRLGPWVTWVQVWVQVLQPIAKPEPEYGS